MSISLTGKEVQRFVIYFQKLEAFKKLAIRYTEMYPLEEAEKLILSFRNIDGEFIFNDDLVQDFFTIWVAGKIDKRDYILGKGVTAVSKGTIKNTEDYLIRLSNIEMFGGGVVGESVSVNKRHSENYPQIDDVVIHCKSEQHAEKIYNAILDK